MLLTRDEYLSKLREYQDCSNRLIIETLKLKVMIAKASQNNK